MDIGTFLTYLAGLVHSNATILSTAFVLVVLGTLVGDALDFVIYAMDHGARKLLSLNVAFSIIAGDPANATAAGAGILAFLGALGAGASLHDAAFAAMAGIATVNSGFLLGTDRVKFSRVLSALAAIFIG